MRRVLVEESGQTTVEYALLAVVGVALALALAFGLTGGLDHAFQTIRTAVG